MRTPGEPFKIDYHQKHKSSHAVTQECEGQTLRLRQFSSGCSIWSMKRTSVGALVATSLSPNCFCKASKKLGPDGEAWSGRSVTSRSGDHSRLKSKVPVRPVRSNTGRSTPVNGFFRNSAIRSMVTFRPPMRPLSGALAEIWPMVPHGIAGSCNPDFDDASAGVNVGAVTAVCSEENPAQAVSLISTFS